MTARAQPQPAEATAFQMYRALVGVGTLCAILIVITFELTRPVIAEKRAAVLDQAIFFVLPKAKSSASFVLSEGRFLPYRAGEKGLRVHAGYDAQKRLVGIAVEAQGTGYQDVIQLLYGYAPEREAIVGLRVLDSRETPGLGERIETDEAFLKNFERLDVSLSDDRSALKHPIEAVKPGKKSSPWQVDTISGATVSSRAVAQILRRSSAKVVPLIARRIEDFSP